MADLVAAAKAAPGKVTMGMPGVGTMHDFAIRLIERSSQTELNPISFKGDAPNLTALLGGHVQVSIAGITSLRPHLVSGDLRGLAITSPDRYEVYPDIPTVKEQGLDAATVLAWVGIFATAGVPDSVLKTLEAAIDKAANAPTVVEGLKKAGAIPGYMNAAEFDKTIKSEVERVKTVIRKGEIK